MLVASTWLARQTSAAVTVLARDLNEFSTTVSKVGYRICGAVYCEAAAIRHSLGARQDTKEVVEEKLVKGVVKGIERTGDKVIHARTRATPPHSVQEPQVSHASARMLFCLGVSLVRCMKASTSWRPQTSRPTQS